MGKETAHQTATVPTSNVMKGHFKARKEQAAGGGIIERNFYAPPLTFRVKTTRSLTSEERTVTLFREHGAKARDLDKDEELYRGPLTDEMTALLEQVFGIKLDAPIEV